MRRIWIAACLVASLPVIPAAASATHIRAELVAETMEPAPGSTITLALRMQPEQGFHGYWLNPGDAGMALEADWSLPAGARIGAFAYPAPRRLLVTGLMNHVYEGRYALLASLHIPVGARRGAAFPVRLTAHWVACSANSCIAESQAMSLKLRIGDGAISPARAAGFAQMRAALPLRTSLPARFERAGKTLRIAMTMPARAETAGAWFYPLTKDATLYAAPQRFIHAGSELILETKVGVARTSEISGVLVLSQRLAYTVTARRSAICAKCLKASGTYTLSNENGDH